MEVTNKMIHAAVKQAVKDKILPTHAPEDVYIHHYESVERMIKAAILAKDEGDL